MAFCPKEQLKKFGWKNGLGLGKEKQGIKEPVKVKLKFDSTGVGHNPGEQFSHQWWDKTFNSAAKNINVTQTEHGVEIKKTGDTTVSTKKNDPNKICKRKTTLYGSFVKAATLADGKEEADSDADDSSDDDRLVGSTAILTDEQLFEVCGGRTAHKGARHNLKQNGKLARIAQQEVELDVDNKIEQSHSDLPPRKKHKINSKVESSEKIKSKKKQKKKETKEFFDEHNVSHATLNENVDIKVKSKKKHKSKKKKA